MEIKLKRTWDSIWMELAKSVATRSTCLVPNRSVGCVIVSGDNTRVLALGYNGSAKGDDNSCGYVPVSYDEDHKMMVGNSRCTCVHAEMNALTKLDTTNTQYKKMYLTLSPCDLCYKLIVNAGIDEVIYNEEYTRSAGLDRLKGLGVYVRQFI